MALYSFKCNACSTKRDFESRISAIKAGWILGTLESAAALRYLVFCPTCIPKWFKEAIGDAGKRTGQKD